MIAGADKDMGRHVHHVARTGHEVAEAVSARQRAFGILGGLHGVNVIVVGAGMVGIAAQYTFENVQHFESRADAVRQITGVTVRETVPDSILDMANDNELIDLAPDDLLKRVVDVSIEDLWDYLQGKGFHAQFDTGFEMLHPEKPFAGRALTAQYMPARGDMTADEFAPGGVVSERGLARL